MNSPRYLKTIVAGAVSLMLAASPASAVTLTIGNGADPGSLDPHKAGGDWEDRIISELFEGLTTENEQAIAVPGQAESWTISDDGLVYTFTLRPEARWSDGRPVVAQNFVDGFRRLFDPATAAGYAYLQFPIRNAAAIAAGEIADVGALGVRAPDERTVEITLEAPTPFFLEALAHFTALPIRKEVIERWGEQWTQPAHIIGNGAYRLVEWVPGGYLRAVKSETYHAVDTVQVDEVRWENSEDLAAAFNRYRAGELDVLTEFPADQYGFLLDRHPGEARVQPSLGMLYYDLNVTRPPFDDIRVRKALSISIRREVIGPDVLGTGELAAYGWVPPGIANYHGEPYRPTWAAEPHEQRVMEARALLEAAGYTSGKPLKLRLRYFTNENQRRVAVAIADMWKQIGVQTELYGSEAAAHFDALVAGDFEVAAAGWLLDYNDASNTLDLLRSGVAAADGSLGWGNNYGRYSNTGFDELMGRAARELDLSTRAELLHEAETLAMDEFAAIPIYWNVSRSVVSPKVKGFTDNVENIHRVRWMSKAKAP